MKKTIISLILFSTTAYGKENQEHFLEESTRQDICKVMILEQLNTEKYKNQRSKIIEQLKKEKPCKIRAMLHKINKKSHF